MKSGALAFVLIALCVSALATETSRRHHHRGPVAAHEVEELNEWASGASGLEFTEEDLEFDFDEQMKVNALMEEGILVEYNTMECEGCLMGVGSSLFLAAQEYSNLLRSNEFEGASYSSGPSGASGATGASGASGLDADFEDLIRGEDDDEDDHFSAKAFRFAAVASATGVEDTHFSELGLGFNPSTGQKRQRVFEVREMDLESRVVGSSDADMTQFHQASEIYSKLKLSASSKFIPAMPEMSSTLGFDFMLSSESYGYERICREAYKEVSIKPAASLQLSTDFKAAAAKLKNVPFTERTRNQYFMFFATYGTHVLDNVVLGGMIHLKEQEKYSLIYGKGELSVKGDAKVASGSLETESSAKKTSNFRTFTGEVFGGDHSRLGLYRTTFNLDKENKPEPQAKDALKKWAESVRKDHGALAVPIEFGYQTIDALISESDGKQHFATALAAYQYMILQMHQRHIAMKEIQMALMKYTDRAVNLASLITRVFVDKYRQSHLKDRLIRNLPLAFELLNEYEDMLFTLHLENTVYAKIFSCFQFQFKKSVAVLHRELQVRTSVDKSGRLVFYGVDSVEAIPKSSTEGDKDIHNTASAVSSLFNARYPNSGGSDHEEKEEHRTSSGSRHFRKRHHH